LIEACGLKGYQLGKARVSSQHANFIVADEGATAVEVIRLADHVRETVRTQTGVDLEREVEVW
jgi:UDP-N-acetylmuramate dehydrogenase